jgi:hypothetical protein
MKIVTVALDSVMIYTTVGICPDYAKLFGLVLPGSNTSSKACAWNVSSCTTLGNR